MSDFWNDFDMIRERRIELDDEFANLNRYSGLLDKLDRCDFDKRDQKRFEYAQRKIKAGYRLVQERIHACNTAEMDFETFLGERGMIANEIFNELTMLKDDEDEESEGDLLDFGSEDDEDDGSPLSNIYDEVDEILENDPTYISLKDERLKKSVDHTVAEDRDQLKTYRHIKKTFPKMDEERVLEFSEVPYRLGFMVLDELREKYLVKN